MSVSSGYFQTNLIGSSLVVLIFCSIECYLHVFVGEQAGWMELAVVRVLNRHPHLLVSISAAKHPIAWSNKFSYLGVKGFCEIISFLPCFYSCIMSYVPVVLYRSPNTLQN